MMCERTWDIMKWLLAGAILSCTASVGVTAFMHYVVGP